MEIRKLQYLEAVYRLQNLTKAAEEQYISQPAMSKAIRSLEEELGVKLLERSKTGITFTNDGEYFIKHVYKILASVERAKEEMKDLSLQSAKAIRFGVSNTAQSWFLPMALSDFIQRHPNYRIEAGENTQSGMLKNLLDESYDFVFTTMPSVLPESLIAVPLMHAELKLVIPSDHPLSRYSYIPFKELDNQILYSYPKGSIIRSLIEDKCNEKGVGIKIQAITTQLQTMYELTSKGTGFSHFVVDPMNADITIPGLTTRSFEEPILIEEGIIYKREHYMNKAVREFIDHLKEVILLH